MDSVLIKPVYAGKTYAADAILITYIISMAPKNLPYI